MTATITARDGKDKVGNKPRTNGDDRSRIWGGFGGGRKERKRTTPQGPISPTQRHGRLMEHQPEGQAAGVAAASNWNEARELIVSRPSKLVDDLIEWRNVVIARSGSPVAASGISCMVILPLPQRNGGNSCIFGGGWKEKRSEVKVTDERET